MPGESFKRAYKDSFVIYLYTQRRVEGSSPSVNTELLVVLLWTV